MTVRGIILGSVFFLAGFGGVCDTIAQTTFEAPGPVLVTPPAEDCSASQPIFLDPSADCSTSQPVYIEPSAPMMVMPQTTGPMFGAPMADPGMFYTSPAPLGATAPMIAPPSGPLSHIAPNGAISPRLGLPAGPDAAPGPNPIQVPVANDEAAWEQIVDVVTEYFPVAREQQARRSGPVWTEGRIETRYVSGATIFEPFSKNSAGSFNRWESTFQTIRRIAMIRVIPDGTGFLVEVVVQKELEDLPRPENSTAGAAVFRTTGSLPSDRYQEVNRLLSSPRWIPLGRDAALENKMLADIQARFTQPPDSSWPTFWW